VEVVLIAGLFMFLSFFSRSLRKCNAFISLPISFYIYRFIHTSDTFCSVCSRLLSVVHFLSVCTTLFVNLKELINKSIMAPYNISPGNNPENGVNTFWGGIWVPYVQTNQGRITSWLPNDIFCSSHVALGAEFEVLDQYISTQWK
jgi:hypothetical protein